MEDSAEKVAVSAMLNGGEELPFEEAMEMIDCRIGGLYFTKNPMAFEKILQLHQQRRLPDFLSQCTKEGFEKAMESCERWYKETYFPFFDDACIRESRLAMCDGNPEISEREIRFEEVMEQMDKDVGHNYEESFKIKLTEQEKVEIYPTVRFEKFRLRWKMSKWEEAFPCVPLQKVESWYREKHKKYFDKVASRSVACKETSKVHGPASKFENRSLLRSERAQLLG